ncbi:hypothetical protein [Paraburkholderia phenazinium]|uniref:hypothetical protein n=1 Tax=Paraburkholderia phenazinium TaxID=60549 RepID=UPI001591C6BC|nr:hypothetical protein [Paraburkholderia phenazinium]
MAAGKYVPVHSQENTEQIDLGIEQTELRADTVCHPTRDRWTAPARGHNERSADGDPREGDGFVIVTAAADAGLVNIHDRRLMVVTADVAPEWLDPATRRKDSLTTQPSPLTNSSIPCQPGGQQGWQRRSGAIEPT